MPFDPTLDELSSEQQRQMTHQAPQPPDFAQRVGQGASSAWKNFSEPIWSAMTTPPGMTSSDLEQQARTAADLGFNLTTAGMGLGTKFGEAGALGVMGGGRGFSEMAARTGNTQSLHDLERAKQLEAQHGPIGRTHVWADTKWYREHGTDIWNKEIYDSPSTLNQLRIPSVRQYLPSETTVGSVLNHPGLYNAYPHTRDLPVIFEENHNPGWHAAYLPPHMDPAHPQGAIYIFNPHATSAAEIKSSLLHELQHSVDQYESRPLRSSFGMPANDYLRLIEEMRARNTQWRAQFTPEQLQQSNMSPWATMRNMQFPFRESEAILPP